MPRRILVVDDEPRVLAIVKKRLELAGYEVSTAVEGFEALKKARGEQPELIVLDLILPGLNGYQICRMLKGDKHYAGIPILMLTARSQEVDVNEGMRVGADAYMTKPYDAGMFLTQISNLLAETDKRHAEEEENLADRLKEVVSKRKWLENADARKPSEEKKS